MVVMMPARDELIVSMVMGNVDLRDYAGRGQVFERAVHSRAVDLLAFQRMEHLQNV